MFTLREIIKMRVGYIWLTQLRVGHVTDRCEKVNRRRNITFREKWGISWPAEYHHHHPIVCLMTGSKPLPKRSLHILRSTASSFKWQYPLLSLRSSSSFLRLLPCLLVTPSGHHHWPSSSSSPSDDRFKASPKTIPPHIAIQSFLLQMRVSSSVLKVIQ